MPPQLFSRDQSLSLVAKTLKECRDHLASLPDPVATAEHHAVAAAVHGAMYRETARPGKGYAKMNDQQFVREITDQFGSPRPLATDASAAASVTATPWHDVFGVGDTPQRKRKGPRL
jgi:hypothetical protein